MRKCQTHVLAFLLIISSVSQSQAASETFGSTNTTDVWSSTTNWGGTAAPGSTTLTTNTDTAFFTVTPTNVGTAGNPLIIDSTTQNIKNLTFTTGTGGGFVIGNPGGNALYLTSGGTISTSGGSNNTVNAPLVLEGNTYTFTNTSTTGGTLTFGGNISGVAAGTTLLTLSGTGTGTNVISGNITGSSSAFGIVVSGGTWLLSGVNSFGNVPSSTFTPVFSDGVTYTVGIEMTGGTLELGSNTAAGTGTIEVMGGTIAAGPGGVSVANNIQNNNNVNIVIGGTNAITFTGALGLNGSNNITVNNTALTTVAVGAQIQLRNRLTGTGNDIINGTGNLTVLGTIVNNSGGTGTGGVALAGTGNLSYQGTGVVTLDGANSYTGTTAVNQGTVVAGTSSLIGTNGAFGNSTTAITLGSTTLTGGASILTNVGGITISRPITETTGTLTNTSLTIGGNQTNLTLGPSIYSGAITLNSTTAPTSTGGTTLTSAAGGEVDFTGVISGTQSLIIGGGGLVKLNDTVANNTFGGAGKSITIQSGSTLNALNAAGALGNASNTVIFNNGTFQFPSVFDLSTRTLTFTGTATFDTDGNAISFANAVGNSGAGGLALNDSTGTGSLTLAAANTYTGGTTVTAGNLILSSAGTLGGTSGALTVNGGTLNLNGTSQAVGNLQGTGGLIYNNGSGTSTLTIGTGGATGGSYAGTLEDNTGSGGIFSLNKTGTGTITLTGSDTYSGATTVGGGVLALSGAGALTNSPVTVASGATIQISNSGSSGTPQISGSLTLNGGTLSLANNAVNNLYLGGTGTVFTLNAGNITFDVGGAGGSDEIFLNSGLMASLSGTNIINLDLLNALNGSNQTLISWSGYTGTGTFSIGSVTNPSFASGYALSLALSASGLVLDESSSSSAYWKGASGSSWSNISNFTTDAGGTTLRTNVLDSNTAVTFTASGATNFSNTTLDGNVTIGSLTFNTAGVGIATGTGGTLTLAGGGSALTVGSGLGTETISANLAMGATQTWTIGSGSTLAISGNISGPTFSLIEGGSGTLILSGTNSYSGSTTVSGGNLDIQSANALGGTSSVAVSNGAALQLQGGFTTSAATPLSLGGSGMGTAGALESVSGNNTYTGAITLNAATTIGSDSGTLTLNSATPISGSNYTLTLAGAGNGAISSAIATGTGGLVQNSSGLWVLSGANSYSGGTTVNAGTLQLSGAGTLGSTNGNLTVNGGLLDLNGTSQGVGNLTGTGGTVANNNGGTNVTLTAGNNNATGGNFAGTIADHASGTGTVSFVKTGTGTITLSGTNSYSGSTVVNGGALNLQSSGAASGSGITVASGAALQMTGGISTSSSVGVTLNGAGVTASPKGALENVSGNNTFGGLVTLGSNTTIGSDTVGNTVTLSNLGTITGSGDNLTAIGAGNTTINSIIGTGSGTVTMNGTGVLTLNGANTYTGATNLNSGTLSYNSAAAISNSSSINIGSGTSAVDFNYSGTSPATIAQTLNFTGSTAEAITLSNSGTGLINYTGTDNFVNSGHPLILGNITDSVGGSIGAIGSGVTTLKVQGLSSNTWTLSSSTNSFTGNTTVNGGVLQIASQAALPSALVTLSGSSGSHAVLQTSGTYTATTGSQVSVGAYAGFSAIGGTLNLNLNGGAALTDGGNYGTGGGAVLVFGSTTSNAQVILPNALSLNTGDTYQQGIYVEKGVGGDSALLSGILSNGTGLAPASGLLKLGGGTLILSNAASTYSGFTSVVGGTLVAENNSPATGAAGVFGTGSGTGSTPVDATIALGQTQSASAPTEGGVINPTIMIGGNYTVANAINVDWANGTGQVYGVGGYLDANSTFSGLITLTGTAGVGNTFAITQVANTGTNALNITGGITSTAGGTVNFNNVGTVIVSGANGIADGGSNSLGVTQSGPGTTILSANNTYSGTTTVTNGTLVFGDGVSGYGLSGAALIGGIKVTGGSLLFNNASSNPAVGGGIEPTTLGGGRIGFSSGTTPGSQISLGALTLTAGTTSVLSFSAINQSITFGSLAISNTSNTILNIYNYVTGDALYFSGTTSPSTAVLNDIFFFSDSGSTSLGNAVEFGTMGQVIPGGVSTPEPSTYITGLCFLVLLAFASRRTQLLSQLQSCLVR